MKIRFITFSCARNYGAVLQTYATYKCLTDLGHEVKMIDYVSLPYQVDREDFVYLSTTRWSKNALTRFLWKYTKHHNELKCRDNFRKFVDEYIPHTPTCFTNDYLINNLPDGEVFIAGSDQIWNTDYSWTGEPDITYFLDFVPDHIPKLAYSSSFGKSSLNEDEKDELYRLLSRFNAIGVRENTGVEILKNLGIESTVVADPTLLCDKQEWDNLASERLVDQDYILLFQIVPNRKLVNAIKKMGKNQKKKVVVLSPDPSQKRILGYKDVVYLPSVEDWLSYFKYADTVITDSFHGTIFAMIFEHDFVSVTTANYNSRITNMLDTVGLANHYTNNVSVENLLKIASDSVDYSITHSMIKLFVDNSISWLTNQLSSIDGRNE